MSLDPNELRKLADSDSRNFDELEIALHEAADEIDRLRKELVEAKAAERAIHYWKEQNEMLQADHVAAMIEACEERCAKNRALAEAEKLQRVYEAADVWMRKSRRLESCAFYPLGAGCTCRLDELDQAITEYEEGAK